MNILLIGNGFDLAHGLPTKYVDFLEFVKIIKQILNIQMHYKQTLNRGIALNFDQIEWGNIHSEVKEIIKYNLGNIKNKKHNLLRQQKAWKDLISCNFWVEYFLQCNMYQKDNWIDFESEISKVVKSFNNHIRTVGLESDVEDNIKEYFSGILDIQQTISTNKQLRDRLLNDLNKFIRAFEIYLKEYVGKVKIEVISPDIKYIMKKIYENHEVKGVILSKVLCFNYTNTYQRVYLNKYSMDLSNYIDYIHGKADINNTIESNNMVLGIDEYLEDDQKNKDISFIAFKKYYQRIYKGTGSKYREWVNKIQEDYFEYMQNKIKAAEKGKVYMPNNINTMLNRCALHAMTDQKCRKHYLYIFGHSLDVTDRDVLRDLILNDNVYTTIFYVNKDVMGQQIANLVKVIGQDELIKRTGGSTKTIEFKQQQVMIRGSSTPM